MKNKVTKRKYRRRYTIRKSKKRKNIRKNSARKTHRRKQTAGAGSSTVISQASKMPFEELVSLYHSHKSWIDNGMIEPHPPLAMIYDTHLDSKYHTVGEFAAGVIKELNEDEKTFKIEFSTSRTPEMRRNPVYFEKVYNYNTSLIALHKSDDPNMEEALQEE